MTSYVTLNLRIDLFDELINDLREYCTQLDNYYEIESGIHLIDLLFEEYFKSMEKQDKQFKEWQEYETLFLERFKDGEFLDNDGRINEKGVYEYKNFNRVNKVLEDYKEGGSLDILDEKQQFFLVLDLLNAMNYKEEKE